MIPFRTTWDKMGYFGAHLYHKYPKSVKKWLSYGYFPIGRLGDSIENHMGEKHILGCFFCAKKIQNQSTNGWVWAFYHLSMRQREILCSFIPKVLKSVKKWLSYCHFLPERSKKIKGNALINISAKSVSRFTFWTLKQLDNII